MINTDGMRFLVFRIKLEIRMADGIFEYTPTHKITFDGENVELAALSSYSLNKCHLFVFTQNKTLSRIYNETCDNIKVFFEEALNNESPTKLEVTSGDRIYIWR